MKYIFKSFLIFAMFITPFISEGQSLNIAFVDLQKIIIESDQGKQIQKIFADETERMKKNVDTKQDELQKLKDTIEKQGATITPEARAEKEKQYQSKLKDYQRLVGDYQAELQQKNEEYMQKILKEVVDIVKTIGEKEKYIVILEKNQAGIIYSTPAVDITDKVIVAFNEAAKKKTPAPATPAAKK